MTDNLTKEQSAVKFNAGAAYAKTHADTDPNEVIGGMKYVFRQSQDLTEEPILQRIIAESQAYLAVNKTYSDAMKVWESKLENERGEKPSSAPPEGYIQAEHSYKQLIYSSDVRTKILSDNYGKLTVQQGIGITLDGKMPDSTPAKIKTAITGNRQGLIKDIRSDKLKKTMEAIMGFYINGETAKNIQSMYLENSLESIASLGN